MKSDLRDEDKTLKKVRKAMNKTAMLSYLLYEDGKIVVDEITPKDRFGIIYKDDTQYTSHLLEKVWSYMLLVMQYARDILMVLI